MHLLSRLLSITLLLTCLSSTTSYSHPKDLCANYDRYTKSTNKQLSWEQFRSKYMLTIASGLIGAATGGLTKYFEKQLGLDIPREITIFTVLWILFAWNFENDLREMSIESVRQDIGSNQENHNHLLSIYARIASWATYLAMSDIPKF